jgi:putative membrane protein
LDWIKALHIIAVISWMAGLLYLPRLFVYHCGAEPGSDRSETLKIMERRLLRAIMNPAMIVAWISGVVLAADGISEPGGWVPVKAALVVLLTVAHMFMAKWRRDFAADRNTHSERFYRIVNEVPTILMIGIVVMVVVKPF